MDNSQPLVSQTANERLLSKVGDLQQENKLKILEEELHRKKGYFVKLFIEKCWDELKISKTDLKDKFTDEELTKLGDLLAERLKFRYYATVIVLMFIPIIGWLELHMMAYKNYFFLYKLLKKSCGNDYFPHSQLREEIRHG